MRPLLAATLFLAFTAPLMAQLTETIEVQVANIDAVVVDQRGNRVTGLTADDFRIFEDGELRPITNFHEVRGEEGITPRRAESGGDAPLPPRQFVLFVDTYSLHPVVRDATVSAMSRFVDLHVHPGDAAAVINWNDGLKLVTPFTSDRAALQSGLSSLRAIASPLSTRDVLARVQQLCTRSFEMARAGRIPMVMAYDECIGLAQNETTAMVLRSRRLLESLEATLAIMGGLEGRKILVVAGAELPERPGLELFQWANALFATSPQMSGFRRPTARPEIDPREQVDLVRNAGRVANSHGVTMYLINVPTFHDPNAVNMSRSGVADAGADFAKSENTAASFESLARITGGIAVSRPGDLDAAMDSVAADARSWYSLGYRPSGDNTGARRVDVRTTNPALRVRARESYVAKTPDAHMRDRTISNVFVPAEAGPWQVTLRTGRAQRAGKLFKVPVEVSMPSTLMLLPQGPELVGGFAVYIVVGSSDGALSRLTKTTHPIAISSDEEDELRREPVRFTATLTVRPGENHISVGVVDMVSHTAGFARATLTLK